MLNDFAVDSRDVNLHQLYWNVKNDPTIENMHALEAELKMRTTIDERFQALFPHHLDAIKNKAYPLPTDFDCLRNLVETYEESCEKLNDYSLKWVSAFVAECEGLKSAPEARLNTVEKIKAACPKTE